MFTLEPIPESTDIATLQQWRDNFAAYQVGELDQGCPADLLCRQLSQHTDELVASLWIQSGLAEYPISLIGVGGYGRGELFPRSDIDLLLLSADGFEQHCAPDVQEMINAFLAKLWDLGLDVGHSVRTVEQCLEMSADDVSTFTSLMESRLIHGDSALLASLNERVTGSGLWSPQAYLDAKLEEQTRRHHRFHDTVYRLEPNIKEGPGGLRDVQTVFWVSSFSLGYSGMDAMVEANLLDEREADRALHALSELSLMRFALHQIVSQKEERLLFPHQLKLAQRLIRDDPMSETQRVEALMQRFFRSAMQIRRFNQALIGNMQRIIARKPVTIVQLDDHYQLSDGNIDFISEQVLLDDPHHLIRIFLMFASNPDICSVSNRARRLIRRHLSLVDRVTGTDHARSLFREIWKHTSRVTMTLKLMHECDLLGMYLSEFAHTIGHMQFDMFHEFTVDQHTLTVLECMDRFSTAENEQDYPLGHDIWLRLNKPELLYIAGFYHDIAKGLGGDHSELGATIVDSFARSHDFSDADTHLLRWLVRHHLIMSVTAQKKDISDPAVIHEFAERVGNVAYLNYLYLLTMADISGTSSKLWNTWRASLLLDLYRKTRAALQRGLENPIKRDEQIADIRAEAIDLLRRDDVNPADVNPLWDSIPAEYFMRHTPDQIRWHTGQLVRCSGIPVVTLREYPGRGVTEVLIYSNNRDGVLAAMVAMLTQMGLNILNAKSFITTDNRLIDTFLVVDLHGESITDEAWLERIRNRLMSLLSADEIVIPAVTRTLPVRLKTFERAARIEFIEQPDEGYSLMEYQGLEEPGLLARILGVFLAQKVRVHKIQVATFGETAEDYFWLSDMHNNPLSVDVQHMLVSDLTTE